MKIPNGVLGLAAILAVVYAVGGWFRGYLASVTATEAPACLELVGSTTSQIDGVTRIIGTVRNGCDRDFNDFLVRFLVRRPENSVPIGFSPTDANAPKLKGPGIDFAVPVTAYGRNLAAGGTLAFQTEPIMPDASYQFDGFSLF